MQRRIDAYTTSRARVSSSMEPKRQSTEISKHPHALGPPFGDMDSKSTLKINQDVNIPVPSFRGNDFKKRKSQIMKRLGDIDQKLQCNSIEDDDDLHPLPSLPGDRKIDQKVPLKIEKPVHGRPPPLLANLDRVQEIRRNIQKCPSDITTNPASKLDDNQEMCEIERPPHSRSHLRTSTDKLEQERTDLTLLKAAWIHLSIISLRFGKVWNGLNEQQKAAYDRAIRFRARSLIPHPDGHWHEIQKFAARIFVIIEKLRAAENSIESADLRAIFLEAAPSKILPLEECKRMQLRVFNILPPEECKRMQLRVFNIGNEQQPMPESASSTANDLLPLSKVEQTTGHNWCIKPEAELAPTPARGPPQKTHTSSCVDATAKVSQEPREFWGHEISPGFIQEPTNKGNHHAGLTKSTGVPPCMAAQVDYRKSGAETVQGTRVNNDFINYEKDEAPTTDKNGRAELDFKFIDPRNKAISHKEPITAELKTAESAAHVNQKLEDRREGEDGLAALITANKNLPPTPWGLKLDGRFFKRTSSQPTLMHKRLLCYGLSTETICKLVTESAQRKDDPIPLTPFRHGVLCAGIECNLPKFMINGEPYELFDIKGKDYKLPRRLDRGTHKLLQPIGVSEAMEMKQDPNQKEQDLLASRHDWNDHDINLQRLPTWNHQNTKLSQLPKAPKEESVVLSNEAQRMMDQARQKALSARAAVVGRHEQEPQTKTNSHNDLMIAQKPTQAIQMSIRNRHAREEARANAWASGGLLAASGENNSGLPSDPVLQRAVQDSGADPVLYKPDNDKPTGHTISCRPSHHRISKLKTDTHIQAKNFDNIAVQRLERWGSSQPDTPVTEKSPPSTAISAAATDPKAHAASDQELGKPAKTEVVNNDDTHIEVAHAEINTADTSIARDFSAITGPTEKDSEIQKLIMNTAKESDDILLTENQFPTAPIQTPTLTSGVDSPKEAQSTDAGVKFEDDWIMAGDDDEAEEWEML